MNEYEARQEAKRERLREKARKLNTESDRLYKSGTESLAAIPFGQPILVGHHSEKGDRAYRGRAVSKIDKSFRLMEEAQDTESRAESVGTGGISSDDPDAIPKLEAKLMERQGYHTLMLEKNKEARANGQPKIFMLYQLANNRGMIAQISKRIEQLQAKRTLQPRPTVDGVTGIMSWRVYEDIDENRILFTSIDKPTEEVRTLLKSYCFKWSPTRGAWVRQLTSNARYSADRLIEKLRAL